MYLKKQSKQLLHFKKWSRKSYAVFNTLHREVKIGVLSLSAFTTMCIQHTDAQTITRFTNDKVDLDEIVVSAEVAPVLQSEMARVVTVITKEEIQASPVNSIADLLEFALNVDVRQRGNHGVQSDISIRGGSFDQVMVLLNGVNISDPQTGHNMMNLPIDLSAVDKIEILQGAGARHLGANAYSGAINIITNSKNENQVLASLSGGEYGFYNANVGASFFNGLSHHFISAGVKGSDGYTENTDFNRQNLFYQGGIVVGPGELNWQAGFTDNSFGANSFYTPLYPNQFEQVKTTVAAIGFSTGKQFKFSPSLYYRNGTDRFELFRAQPDVFPYNFHRSDVYGTRLNFTAFSSLGKTSFGGELRSENALSNTLGNTPDTVKVPGFDAYYLTSYNRTNYSLFGEHQFSYGKLFITTGVMAYGSTALDGGITFYPGADASLELFRGFRVKGAVNRSLRMPTFTDLFYNGPTNVGNPDLKPETAWSYEAGLKYHNYGFSSHITAFYRSGKDLIDWVLFPDRDKYQTVNYTRLNTYGLETAASYNFKKAGHETFFVNRLSLTYAFLESDKLEQDYDSRYVLDYLKHKFTFSLNHRVFKSLFADWNFSWQDRAGAYQKYLGKNPETNMHEYAATDYKPFWLVNTKVYWQSNWGMVFVEASNLLNEQYTDVANVPQPGRWLRLGANVKINY